MHFLRTNKTGSASKLLSIPQELERRLKDAQSGWQVSSEASEREWARRLADVELNWEKRLRDGWV
jgi:hypothetical protein